MQQPGYRPASGRVVGKPWEVKPWRAKRSAGRLVACEWMVDVGHYVLRPVPPNAPDP